MCVDSAIYRLSFILPDSLYETVPRGRHAPCLHGCLLTVHGAGLVSIVGRPREAVFDQAQRFLRVQGRGHGHLSVPATLTIDTRRPERWLLSAGRAVQMPYSQPMLPGLGDDEVASAR